MYLLEGKSMTVAIVKIVRVKFNRSYKKHKVNTLWEFELDDSKKKDALF